MSNDKLDATRRIENIELIRDILFGPQLKEYSDRLHHLENAHKAFREETASNLKNVRDELNKRTEEIKQILREFQSAVKTIREDLKVMGSSNAEEKNELRQQIDRLSKRLATNVSNLDEAMDKQVSSLRDDLVSSHRKQQADVLALRNEVFEELEKRLSSLSSMKITREDLAESFIEMAFKLKGGETFPALASKSEPSDAEAGYGLSDEEPPSPPSTTPIL
jgi:predicted  nucleic acid-binding Zn-ribbon protein